MYLSEIHGIKDEAERKEAYQTWLKKDGGRYRNDSLGNRISAGVELAPDEIEEVISTIASRCRAETKDKLQRRLGSVKALGNCGMFERLTFEDNANFRGVFYCAGQDYPAELKRLRERILKG